MNKICKWLLATKIATQHDKHEVILRTTDACGQTTTDLQALTIKVRTVNSDRNFIQFHGSTETDTQQPLTELGNSKGLLKKWRNMYCYIAQDTTRLGGSCGPISTTKAIQDACEASWRGSGWCVVTRATNEE